MPIAALAVPAITAGLTSLGVTGLAATAGGLLGGAALGAGAGAGIGALTGQGAARGAEIGGISTIGGEVGGAVGNLVGFPGIGSAVGGAIGGGIGSVAGGGSFLPGALEGVGFGSSPSLFGEVGGIFGGGATPVPADATAGAVQPSGTPVPGGATTGTQLASMSDVGGGDANVSNISPTDVSGLDWSGNVPFQIDPTTTVGGLGPTASGLGQGPYQVGLTTLQPTAAGGGDIYAGSTMPAAGTAPASPYVGPTDGTMFPPPDATGGTPVAAGSTGGAAGAGVAGDVALPSGNTGQYAPGSAWQTVTNPGDISSLAADPYQAQGAYTAAGGAPSSPLGDIANMIKNPAALIPAAAGLYQMATTKKAQAAEIAPLQTAATGAGGMATALVAPSMTGVLPVGAAQALENERRKKFATIEGQARATGMSGSTMERDAKLQANADIATQQFGIEQNLLTQAKGYSDLQSTDLQKILEAKRLQDLDYAAALARFTGGLAGSMTPQRATA